MKVLLNVLQRDLIRRDAKMLRKISCIRRRLLSNRAQETAAIVGKSSAAADSQHDKMKPLEEIPGPRVLPLVGSGWMYSPLGPYSINSMPLEARDGLLKKYGPIYKEKLGGSWIISVHNPEDIQEVMKVQGDVPNRNVNESMVSCRKARPDLFTTVGIIESTGEEWHNLRKKVSPVVLKSNSIDCYISGHSSIADEFIYNIKKDRDSQTGAIEDIRNLLYKFGLEATWLFGLGERLGTFDSPPSARGMMLMKAILNLFFSMAKLSMSIPWWKIHATNTYKQLCNGNEVMQMAITKRTKEMLTSFEKDPPSSDLMLFKFLSMKDFKIGDINVVLGDFIFGGMPTTAFFLSLFLHRLGQEKQLVIRLQQEVSEVLPDKTTDITAADLSRLTLLKASINEGYRLCSIITGIFRVVSRDVFLSGFRVPSLTPILCQTRAASRLESNFSHNDQFIPERWMKPSQQLEKHCPNQETLYKEARANRFLVLPFGIGPRACVGRKLAENEMLVLMTKILLNFDIHSEGQVKLGNHFVIGPDENVKISFTDR